MGSCPSKFSWGKAENVYAVDKDSGPIALVLHTISAVLLVAEIRRRLPCGIRRRQITDQEEAVEQEEEDRAGSVCEYSLL